jgi:hypothetical protein
MRDIRRSNVDDPRLQPDDRSQIIKEIEDAQKQRSNRHSDQIGATPGATPGATELAQMSSMRD